METGAYGVPLAREGTGIALRMLVGFFKALTVVLGGIGLTLADVAFGAAALGILWKGMGALRLGPLDLGFEFGPLVLDAGELSLWISLATSSMQVAMWDMLLRKGSRAYGAGSEIDLTRVAPKVVMWGVLLAVTVLDTVLDGSYSMVLFSQGNPLDFPPSAMPGLFWVGTGLIMLLTGCNEYLVAILLEHVKPGWPKPPPEPHRGTWWPFGRKQPSQED